MISVIFVRSWVFSTRSGVMLRSIALSLFRWSVFFSSRRRHTRCSRDWSSDECSSDLFDGLQQAASSVERLRNFADRLKRGKFPAGKQEGMAARISKAAEEFDVGLSDDLNTARALAAEIGRASCRERV